MGDPERKAGLLKPSAPTSRTRIGQALTKSTAALVLPTTPGVSWESWRLPSWALPWEPPT